MTIRKSFPEDCPENIYRMKNALIDTDVILDFFFDRIPHSDYAASIFSLCEAERLEGYVTPVICSNVFYILRQTARQEKVIEKLNQLMRIMGVLQMNKDTVIHALNSGFKDFEDAMQNSAAQASGIIDVILTRNVRDYTRSETGVLTPENFLKMLE